jgi:hypothetical protein
MLTAINGYYNGSYIVMSENVTLQKGQKVIITVDVSEAPIKKIDLSSFMGRGKKMFNGDAAEYVNELRENDRV